MTAGACLFGCIEGGGTKFVLGLLTGSRGIVETRTIPTEAPAETIGQASHDIIAYYIAQLCITLQAVVEPGRIVIGGGVARTPGLHDRIGMEAARLGAGYFRGRADKVIVPPAFAKDAHGDGP